MLLAIRDRATGWIAWTIVILITIPFALWGINSYFDTDSRLNVAEVNGTEIPAYTFRNIYQVQRRRMSALLGGAANGLMDEDVLKRSVLDSIIDRQLMAEAVHEAGYRVGDEQLLQAIRSRPEFQQDKHFSPLMYEARLRSLGQSKAQFEADLRQGIAVAQMRNGIESSAFVLPAELERIAALEFQERDLVYGILYADELVPSLEVSDEEAQAYYDGHPDAFQIPERVSIEYVELKLADLAKEVSVDEQALRDLYEDQRERLRKEDRRRASHILVEIPPGENGRAQALAQVNDLLQRLKDGESFEELAKTHSADKGSAAQGGDLGFVNRGMMDEAFDQALFSLAEGEISEPVETAFGIHLIKVTAIEAGEQKSFEEARAELESEYRRNQAENLFYDRGEVLADLTYEHPDTLETAAQALGLEIKSTDSFTRMGGTGVAESPKVVQAAFSEDVLQRGNNSEPLELDSGHLLVLRVKEHQPAAMKPLAEVRAQVDGMVKREKASRQVEEKGKELLAKARAGDASQVLAEAFGEQLKRVGWIARMARGHDPAILTAAFRAAKGSEEKPALAGTALASGDYAVLMIKGVRDGKLDALSEENRQRLEEVMRRNRNIMIVDALIGSLRQAADIRIFEENL
jgi:peptidyl-prolyl cis-trans isomerase D